MQIEITKMTISSVGYSFVAVEAEYPPPTKPVKLRSGLSQFTHRPSYQNSLFIFPLAPQLKLKFGLFFCDSPSGMEKARLVGVSRLNVSEDRLTGVETRQLELRGKQVSGMASITLKKVFEPIISRVLFSEGARGDELRVRTNLKVLEREAARLFAEWMGMRQEEQTLDRVCAVLRKDENQIRDAIEQEERLNSKLEHRLRQEEDVDGLTLEINILKESEEGRRLLLEKLRLMELRIEAEEERLQRRVEEYEEVKGVINERIKEGRQVLEKLRGKELQQFQISKNAQMLERYQEVEFQFRCNEGTLRHLLGKCGESEFTAQQASLLMSQVKYQIKLEQLTQQTPQDMENTLQKIDSVLASTAIGEEEGNVMAFKLDALLEKIQNLKSKM